MSLTKSDLKDVRNIVIDALEALVLPRFDRLETDVDVLKTDVAILKTDVAVLKTDVAVLKTDVAVLKTDVAVLKTDVSELKRDIVEVKGSLRSLDSRVSAMENDIKDIYYMIADLQKSQSTDNKFAKMTLEQKLLKLNKELLATAKEAGISLPR